MNPMELWLLLGLAFMLAPIPVILVSERLSDLGMRVFWIGSFLFFSWAAMVLVVLSVAAIAL